MPVSFCCQSAIISDNRFIVLFIWFFFDLAFHLAFHLAFIVVVILFAHHFAEFSLTRIVIAAWKSRFFQLIFGCNQNLCAKLPLNGAVKATHLVMRRPLKSQSLHSNVWTASSCSISFGPWSTEEVMRSGHVSKWDDETHMKCGNNSARKHSLHWAAHLAMQVVAGADKLRRKSLERIEKIENSWRKFKEALRISNWNQIFIDVRNVRKH